MPKSLERGRSARSFVLKTHIPHGGLRKLRDIYQRVHGQAPSESSFKRVLDRAGLVEKRRLRRRSEAGRSCSGRKASAPNEIWTVDFKGLVARSQRPALWAFDRARQMHSLRAGGASQRSNRNSTGLFRAAL